MYAIFRFFIEYVRVPDQHLQFILLNLTMGQLLCIAMMIGGIVIWFTGYKTATEN